MPSITDAVYSNSQKGDETNQNNIELKVVPENSNETIYNIIFKELSDENKKEE